MNVYTPTGWVRGPIGQKKQSRASNRRYTTTCDVRPSACRAFWLPRDGASACMAGKTRSPSALKTDSREHDQRRENEENLTERDRPM